MQRAMQVGGLVDGCKCGWKMNVEVDVVEEERKWEVEVRRTNI